MRVLILGGTGFCGLHLARQCLDAGDDVVIAGRSRHSTSGATEFEALKVDITDSQSLLEALKKVQPQEIYQLAGLASVARSLGDQEAVYKVNVLGNLRVIAAVKDQCPKARVLVIGSAEEYGRARAEDLPLKEQAPLRPRSPYGVSRVASTLMALREGQVSGGLDFLATRTFNLTGPGQSRTYVCSDFAYQIADAVSKGQSSLLMTTGNLEARRDFSSVIDGMKAYRGLMKNGQRGQVYNVCSGQSRSIASIVEMLSEIAGIPVTTQTDPKRLRPSDLPDLRGDPGALEALVGFRPGSLREALTGLYKEWLESF